MCGCLSVASLGCCHLCSLADTLRNKKAFNVWALMLNIKGRSFTSKEPCKARNNEEKGDVDHEWQPMEVYMKKVTPVTWIWWSVALHIPWSPLEMYWYIPDRQRCHIYILADDSADCSWCWCRVGIHIWLCWSSGENVTGSPNARRNPSVCFFNESDFWLLTQGPQSTPSPPLVCLAKSTQKGNQLHLSHVTDAGIITVWSIREHLFQFICNSPPRAGERVGGGFNHNIPFPSATYNIWLRLYLTVGEP